MSEPRKAEAATSSLNHIVNGINVDDLFALIGGINGVPATGMTNWRVTTTWQGQTRSRSQVEAFAMGGRKVPRRFSIDIDEPCELGGSNAFANPQEHLLAALNACMTVGYVAQCAAASHSRSWRLRRKATSTLRGFLGRDPAIPPGYEKLRYVVRVKGNGSKEQFAEVHQAVMATSANFYNVSQHIAPATDPLGRVSAMRIRRGGNVAPAGFAVSRRFGDGAKRSLAEVSRAYVRTRA